MTGILPNYSEVRTKVYTLCATWSACQVHDSLFSLPILCTSCAQKVHKCVNFSSGFTVHEDLTALEDWESRWQMSVRPEKCMLLRITTSERYRKETNYFLHGRRLQVTKSAKYLGVTLNDDIPWEKHTKATAAKASRTLGFLSATYGIAAKRTLQLHTSPWSDQQWSMLPHFWNHTRQKMSTALMKSNVAQNAMLAITTRSGPQDVSQQW